MSKKSLPDKQSTASSPSPMHLPVSVVIGSPRDNCSKYGICEVDALSQEAWDLFVPGHLRLVKAQIYQENAHRIRFYFPMDGMLPCTRQHFFESGVFIVLSEKELPVSFARKLGLSAIRISPGYYPVETLPGAGYNVRFSI